ncbi:MAG: ATP-binding protein [Desulfuromonadales bacterium C00003096]|nr:MAG: ATP-binding protein [Desulfuromonadales bacterium C00003096]
MKKKTFLSWSSGKDSAWALHVLRQDPEIDLLGLFTVANKAYGRVSMHATRADLLKRQADALDLVLQIINIPHPCSNEECDAIMRSFVDSANEIGIECMAFGDLFLQDVREYRENQLRGTGIKPIFPIWNIPTNILAEQMLSSGVEAYISCVDPRKVPGALAGRRWSEELLKEFPENVDPCGENGEFHTIVVGGPMFRESIPIHIGETVERESFVFTDIIPEN